MMAGKTRLHGFWPYMIRTPRDLLLYLALGRQRFDALKNGVSGHSCYYANTRYGPFPDLLCKPSDNHEHLTTLYLLSILKGSKTIVELGTADGESTISLLSAARETGGMVYSFDIEPCEEAKKLVHSYGLENFWCFTQGDDRKADWRKPIDHLYIDTSHYYEHTLYELEKFEPLVRNGGVITMHDSTVADVSRAVKDHFKKRRDVKVLEYLNNNGLFIILKGEERG